MLRKQLFYTFAALFLLVFLSHCKANQEPSKDDYWLSFHDAAHSETGYKKPNGDIAIAAGKYPFCFTDTFRNFAIVAHPAQGLVAIDKQEQILYQVFPFDNGPDEPSEGLFRIEMNHKIGFADAKSGKIIINPQYDGAYPFRQGVAKVNIGCQTATDGEHSTWVGGNWFHIDKTGKKAEQPTH
jgi:hypothetical protein